MSKKKIKPHNAKNLLEGYIEKGLNNNQIAEIFDVSPPVISRWRKECGIINKDKESLVGKTFNLLTVLT